MIKWRMLNVTEYVISSVNMSIATPCRVGQVAKRVNIGPPGGTSPLGYLFYRCMSVGCQGPGQRQHRVEVKSPRPGSIRRHFFKYLLLMLNQHKHLYSLALKRTSRLRQADGFKQSTAQWERNRIPTVCFGVYNIIFFSEHLYCQSAYIMTER